MVVRGSGERADLVRGHAEKRGVRVRENGLFELRPRGEKRTAFRDVPCDQKCRERERDDPERPDREVQEAGVYDDLSKEQQDDRNQEDDRVPFASETVPRPAAERAVRGHVGEMLFVRFILQTSAHGMAQFVREQFIPAVDEPFGVGAESTAQEKDGKTGIGDDGASAPQQTESARREERRNPVGPETEEFFRFFRGFRDDFSPDRLDGPDLEPDFIFQ